MEGYNKSSHSVYRCEYHFVWVPKYRYHVLVQEVKERLRKILTELCSWMDITIVEGAICSDHIHMYLSVPPKWSPAEVMKILKGKTHIPDILGTFAGISRIGSSRILGRVAAQVPR